MKVLSVTMLMFAVFMPASFAADELINAAPEGFKPLFNGKDLDGWWGLGTESPHKWMALPADKLAAKKKASLANIKKHWRVEGNELVNDGKGLYLTTATNYGNFELLLQYKTVKKADSGIYLRGYPQVQIWDSKEGSGGLWNNAGGSKGKKPLVVADKPFGEWNQFRIKMIGANCTIHLNGKLVVDDAPLHNYFQRKNPLVPAGPIQLQTHGGQVRWRHLYIREIGGAQPAASL